MTESFGFNLIGEYEVFGPNDVPPDLSPTAYTLTSWLQSRAYPNLSIPGQWKSLFDSAGIPTGSFQDRHNKWLIANSYSGDSYQDRLSKFKASEGLE